MTFKRVFLGCIAIIMCIMLGLICGCTDDNSEVTANSKDSKATVSKPAPSKSEKTPSKAESKVVDMSIPWREHPQDFKLIALTFDDAPAYSDTVGNNTVTIVDTLKKYDGAATLFVNANRIENKGTAVLQYALDNGFELANHGLTHVVMTNFDRDQVFKEIKGNQDYVKEKLGVDMKFFRASNTAYTQTVFDVCHELDLPCFNGNRRGALYDYDQNPKHDSQYILDISVNRAYDGQVTLMHSWSDKTTAVIDEICSTLYDQGYRFVTLSELFEYKNIDVHKRFQTINYPLYDTTLEPR